MSLYNDASLLLIPSGYKSGTVYCQKPTDGSGDLTFTRASSATRVNSDGLIEKVRTNLFFPSDTSDALVTRATRGSSTTIKGVSGFLYSDDEGVPNINKSLASYSIGFATFSIYIDTTNANSIQLNFAVEGSANNGTKATFNATTETWSNIVENTSYVSSGSTQLSFEDLGDNVFRLSIGANFTASGSTYFPVVYFGTGNTNVAIGGAQVEQGLVATDYIPTTSAAVSVGMTADVPRLDYTNSSCPSLLLEPQRTNLFLYSEEFDDAYWSKVNLNTSGTPSWINALLSPDGTQNADILIPNTTTSAHQISRASVGYLANTSFTFSMFLKENGFRYAYLSLLLRNGSTFQENVIGLIDLQSKTISISGTNTLFTNVEVRNLGDYQNGFTRYSISAKTPVSGSDRLDVQVRCVDSSGGAIAGDDIGGIGIWGAQLEEGAYATSYIPTTTATVTRIADTFTRNNIYTNGLISASGGTWFVELKNNVSYTRDGTMRLGIGDTVGLTANSIFLNPSTSGRYLIIKSISGSITTLLTTTTDNVKLAIKWNGATADVFANGVKVVSATSFTTTLMENFLTTAMTVPTFIQQMALFNTPLSDSDCITLTTL